MIRRSAGLIVLGSDTERIREVKKYEVWSHGKLMELF